MASATRAPFDHCGVARRLRDPLDQHRDQAVEQRLNGQAIESIKTTQQLDKPP